MRFVKGGVISSRGHPPPLNEALIAHTKHEFAHLKSTGQSAKVRELTAHGNTVSSHLMLTTIPHTCSSCITHKKLLIGMWYCIHNVGQSDQVYH